MRLQRIEMDVSKLNDLKKAVSLWKKRHKGAPDTELGPPAYTLYTTPKQVIEDLNKAPRYYLFIKGAENEETPRQIQSWLRLQKRPLYEIPSSQYFIYRRKLYVIERSVFEIGPIALIGLNDALSVDLIVRAESAIFQLITIKDNGALLFRSFLESIPKVGPTIKEISNQRKHTSRYSFEPYVAAVEVWRHKKAYRTVPETIRKFFQGTIRYFAHKEWRTSIVLSAIIVESLLAEIHEETFHRKAPNVPLGALLEDIKTKAVLPNKIIDAINLANESRISAVHRSSIDVSEKEAIDALVGATQFSLWYFSLSLEN